MTTYDNACSPIQPNSTISPREGVGIFHFVRVCCCFFFDSISWSCFLIDSSYASSHIILNLIVSYFVYPFNCLYVFPCLFSFVSFNQCTLYNLYIYRTEQPRTGRNYGILPSEFLVKRDVSMLTHESKTKCQAATCRAILCGKQIDSVPNVLLWLLS